MEHNSEASLYQTTCSETKYNVLSTCTEIQVQLRETRCFAGAQRRALAKGESYNFPSPQAGNPGELCDSSLLQAVKPFTSTDDLLKTRDPKLKVTNVIKLLLPAEHQSHTSLLLPLLHTNL